MKIRIKANSVRLRLSRSEVTKLGETGYLEETTCFGKNTFVYALKSIKESSKLSAAFDDGKITVFIPLFLIEGWPANNTVGFDATMKLTETDSLYILVEKDFICMDETLEDQSDHYENPSKSC